MRKYFKYIKTQRRKTVVADYNRQEKTLFILLDEEIDQDTVDKIKRNIDDEMRLRDIFLERLCLILVILLLWIVQE